MVDLAEHESHTAKFKFLATYAAGGNRLEEADSIAALAEITVALRSAATVKHERKSDSAAQSPAPNSLLN